MDKTLLINPVSTVHDRHVNLFRKYLPEWKLRCIYNPNFQWFDEKKGKSDENTVWFTKSGRLPINLFDNIKAVLLFSAQPRIPHMNLIQQAALKRIPVIAVEEVYQLTFEQGYVNEYFIPVDRFLVASEYERKEFIKIGVPENIIEATGCIFRHRTVESNNEARKEKLLRELEIPASRKIATLCLAYLSPLGETLEVRQQLLKCLSAGLPEEYVLIIKPHPAEDYINLTELVKRCVPGAKIVNQHTPINDVLDITDILFNRGNSQVIIDALQRNIPVAVIPMGRKILFDGILDELVINKSEDIARFVYQIQKNGIEIYNKLSQYFSITPEDAIEKTISRIKEISLKNELFAPEERLLKISLFWAWMGYSYEAKRTLSLINKNFNTKNSVNDIFSLISYKADHRALKIIKKWAQGTYIEWIIQSIWVKAVYLKRKKMNNDDKLWFINYPPKMNRESFLPFLPLLYMNYLKSGMREEAEILLNKMRVNYLPGNSYFSWLRYYLQLKLKNLQYMAGQLTDHIRLSKIK